MKSALELLVPADPHASAGRLGAGRTAFAVGMLAAPAGSLRLMGADTATAQRVSWLARMMAVRDGVLGVGAVVADRRGGDAAPWLLAGAVSDTVDALAIAGAIKQGRLKGAGPTGTVVGALGVAALGFVAAARLRRT